METILFFVSLASCVNLDTIVGALGGAYSLEDVRYSIESLWDTGVVHEDSVFWNCATMGNRSCG